MGRQQEAPRPVKRNGFWYLVRRVPAEFRPWDERGIVFVSSGIRIVDDPRGASAGRTVGELDRLLQQLWRDRRAGREEDGDRAFEEAVARVHARGFTYKDVTELEGKASVFEVVERIEAVAPVKTKGGEVAAVLGLRAAPQIKVSGLVDEYEKISGTLHTEKSEKQKVKWRAQKDRALEVFLQVVGSDRPVASLTRQDALEFRKHWQERVVAGEVQIDTANKSLGHVGSMFRAVVIHHQLELPAVFDNLRIPGMRKRKRRAFEIDFVQERILAEGMFEDLNDEARRVIYVMVETGLRLSEACNLTARTIKLEHKIPHVQVRPEGREMKTVQSERDIPLVGVALMAMRAQPEGFPRYREKADSLSALVNKAMEARGLIRHPDESLYSLRHTFEDRLERIGASETMKARLMGHKKSRTDYGEGPMLDQKAEWLSRMAYRPPSRV